MIWFWDRIKSAIEQFIEAEISSGDERYWVWLTPKLDGIKRVQGWEDSEPLDKDHPVFRRAEEILATFDVRGITAQYDALIGGLYDLADEIREGAWTITMS